MKRIIVLVMVVILLFTGCQNIDSDKQSQVTKEVKSAFDEAKNGKYENLNFLCDEIRLSDNGRIEIISLPVNSLKNGWALEDKLQLYKDVIFPKLYNVECIDTSHIFDLESEVIQDFDAMAKNGRIFENDYAYMLEHVDSYGDTYAIGYYDKENYQYMESFPEGVCISVSQGKIGSYAGSASCYVSDEFEEVKTYNCYVDDLSDSYLLVDGEKTVAEAKAEIEEYFDSRYPLFGENNGIKNEVYKITVKKIPNSDCYMYIAHRTLTYNGVPVKEEDGVSNASEVGVMGEAMLCESNKVDITKGFVNCFSKGTVIKTYEEILPFDEVLEGVSYCLTGETAFDIVYAGLQYRMFTTVEDGQTYYNWIPYWSFLAQNPNDDSFVRVFVDIETGEIQSYQI